MYPLFVWKTTWLAEDARTDNSAVIKILRNGTSWSQVVFDEETVSQSPDIDMSQLNPVSIHFVFVNPVLSKGLARILELLDSNLARGTSYFRNSRDLPQSLQGTCRNITAVTAVSLYILFKCSFKYYPVIRLYIIWVVTAPKICHKNYFEYFVLVCIPF